MAERAPQHRDDPSPLAIDALGRRSPRVSAQPWLSPVQIEAGSRRPAGTVNSAGIAARAEERLPEGLPEHLLHPPAPRRLHGWRRGVQLVTAGRLSPRPSAADRRRAALEADVATPFTGCRRIAVISRKGGIGKTTTTLMLGHTFAALRGDHVIALDADPDAGSLGYRVARDTEATITQLIAASDEIERYSDIRRFTTQAPSRLEVVAADDDPEISSAINGGEYLHVINLLERYYNLVLVDGGTGVLGSAAQGVLRACDQVVVCAGAGIDAFRASSSTLEWLLCHGYGELAREAVVVINGVSPKAVGTARAMAADFERRCRAVVTIPWDPRLAAGAETTLEELRPQTRDAYLAAAAAVGRGFPHRIQR